MEEDVLDIKLMNRPVAGERQREHGTYGGWLDDGTKSLREVNARTLCEAAQHPARLVALKRSIRLEFVLENPFTGHNIGPRWSRNKIPRALGQQGVELLLHGTSPIWISKATSVGSRNR